MSGLIKKRTINLIKTMVVSVVICTILQLPALADGRGGYDLEVKVPIKRWDETMPFDDRMASCILWVEKKQLHFSFDYGDLWDARLPNEIEEPCLTKELPVSQTDNKSENNNICRIKTVLILGNSIVRVTPTPKIGWYGDWGMAASERDSDFVHLLIRDIHQKDQSVAVKFRNIADFERDFCSYNLSILDSLQNPDMLIMKISENVDDTKALEDNFIFWYDALVKYIAPKGRSIKVIIDGFWANKNVNRLMKEYALKNNYSFVTITSLSEDTTNMANGEFIHKGVAAHPSDKGMRMIEQRIWDSIKRYFE